MAKNTLVSWKKKEDEYRDDMDSDFGIHAPRMVDTLQETTFIMSDETNADAFRAVKLKPWW